nr:hypothetical protein [Legionella jordanis]
MKKPCRLCENNSELKKSHIIPKSIIKWMKNTSATGYLRSSENMNIVKQDGLKLPFLCSECECLFSTYEKYFYEQIFLPLHDDKERIAYNNNLLKFAASLSWRALKYFIEEDEIDHLNEKQIKNSTIALQRWKDYLFNKENSPGIFELHFYNFIGVVSSTGDLPNNTHRYLHRSIDFNLYSSSDVAFIYIKLPGLIIIGYITLPNDIEEFRDTRIKVANGKINPMNYTAPIYLLDIIKDEAQKIAEYQNSISEKQQSKINDKYKNNTQRASQSRTVQAIREDMQLSKKHSIINNDNKDK